MKASLNRPSNVGAYDLASNPRIRLLLGMMLALGVYAFVDGLECPYAYAGAWPAHWFWLATGSAFCFSVVVGWAAPVIDRLGVALLFAAVSAAATIPGLLRLNLVSGGAFQMRAYVSVGVGVYKSVEPGLPELHFSDHAKFWSTFKKGSQRDFRLAYGWLGFYQYDLEEIRAEMRDFYDREARP